MKIKVYTESTIDHIELVNALYEGFGRDAKKLFKVVKNISDHVCLEEFDALCKNYFDKQFNSGKQ